MVSDRDKSRVTVGCYLDPITPLWATRANVASARLMGADDIWVGDHVRSVFPSTAWSPKLSPMARFIPSLDAYLDPTVVIARWAGRLGITMGMSVTDAIRRTPADLARSWMSLHHMTGGHAVLGIGSGEHENVVPYGQSMERRVSRLEDTLCAIREAWESGGKPLTHEGEFHRWKDATFALPKRRGTTPPVWVAAQGPRACRVAGRYGDGWLYIPLTGVDAWHDGAAQVVNGATEAGRDPNAMTRSLYFAPLPARNRAAMEQIAAQPMVHAMALTLPAAAWTAAGARHPLGDDYTGFIELDPKVLESESLREYGKDITVELLREIIPFGNAEHIVEQLRPVVDAGVNHVIIYSAASALKPSLAAGSLIEQRRLMQMLKKLKPGPFGK